jgi:hypothetical protein
LSCRALSAAAVLTGHRPICMRFRTNKKQKKQKKKKRGFARNFGCFLPFVLVCSAELSRFKAVEGHFL